MAENTPDFGGSLMEPGHSGARPMDSLKGSMGPVHMQAAGLNMNEGEPANATGTSEPAMSDLSHLVYPHQAGTSGAAANAREDNQANVF
jgi:hypothetical protein